MAAAEEQSSILDLLIVLAKHKRLVLGLPLCFAVLVAGISFLFPNIYTGTTRILPPQQQQSTTLALLGQLGISGGVGSALGLKNPADFYVGMLKSRTIADNLIQRFKLQELYDEDSLVETRRALERVTDISAGKDGILLLSVEDEDPKRAAAIANAYIDELDKLTQGLAVGEAAQRRLFFDRQLKATKDELARAEIELRQTQEATGLIQLDGQAQAIISGIAMLRAQVVAKEAELAAVRSYATVQHPEYIRGAQQLSSLRAELATIQRKHKVDAKGEVILPSGNLPQAGLEYIRRLRDVKYQETLFELLARQLELAKVDEAKDAAIIQVVDRAVEPDKKSKPRRGLIALVAAFAMFFVAVVIAFWLEFRDRGIQDPALANRLSILQEHLQIWRSK